MSREKEIAELRTTLTMESKDFEHNVKNVTKQTNSMKRSFDIVSKSIEDSEDKLLTMEKALKKGEDAISKMNEKLSLQVKRFDTMKTKISEQNTQYQKLESKLTSAKEKLNNLTNEEIQNIDAIEKQKKAVEDLESKLENKAKAIQNNMVKLQNYSNDIEKTETEIIQFTSKVNKLNKEFNDLKISKAKGELEGFERKLNTTKEEIESASKSLVELSEELNNAGDSASGASKAIGAIGGASVLAYAEADNAFGKIMGAMGTTKEETDKLLDRVQALAEDGFDFSDSIDAIIGVENALGDLLSDNEVDDLTGELLAIAKTCNVDVNDSIKAVSSMMKNFEISGQEATDIIAFGLQNGLNISDDFIDTLWEYSGSFSDMGFTAQDTLAIINSGMKDGAFNTDKLADGVKEFNLRLSDLDDSGSIALESLGFNFNDVTTAINNGGDSAKNMAVKVALALTQIEDETERNKLSVALFGTQYEDVGNSIVTSLAGVSNANLDVKGSADQLKQSFLDTFGAEMSAKIQELKEPLISLGETVLMPLIETGTNLLTTFADWFSTLDEGTIKAIGGFGIFTMAVAPLIKTLATVVFIASNLGLKFGGLTTVMGGTGGAAALLASPVGLGVLAVALAGLVSVVGDNEQALGWLQEKFGSLGVVVGGVCEFLSGTIQLTFGTMLSWVELAIDGMAAMIDGPGGLTIEQAWSDHWTRLETNTAESMDKILLTTTRDLSQQRNNVDAKTKETADVMDKNTKAGADAIGENMALASQVSLDESGNIPKHIQTNMDASVKAMRQAGSDIYNGMNTSFKKLSDNSNKYFESMQKTATKESKLMAKNGRQAGSDLYNGVTTSTRKMADKTIADWSRIRSYYANPIKGRIEVQKTQKTIFSSIFQQNSIDPASMQKVENLARLSLPRISFREDVTPSRYISRNNESSLKREIDNQNKLITQLINKLDILDKIEIPVNIDGREITRVVSKNLAGNTRRI